MPSPRRLLFQMLLHDSPSVSEYMLARQWCGVGLPGTEGSPQASAMPAAPETCLLLTHDGACPGQLRTIGPSNR